MRLWAINSLARRGFVAFCQSENCLDFSFQDFSLQANGKCTYKMCIKLSLSNQYRNMFAYWYLWYDISHCKMFKALFDSADGVSTGGSGASSSSGPVKVWGCPHIRGKAGASSGLNMGPKFNVQCMYAVMRSATCDFTTIASGRMILSIKSIIRKTWGSECPFRQRHENTGRSDACRYCIFWSILPLLFHAILCFPGLSATWHHGSRAKWLTVAKSRLPLMSMKTLAGCANANSKQEPVQILSLQKVPECSGMGRAWPCNAGTNKSGSSLLCSVFTWPRRWRWNLEASWSRLFCQIHPSPVTSRPS